MRHKKSGRKLGRNPSHRKALFCNMAKALLGNGRITTTEAKAKTLRGVVEPLITLALKNDLHARRQAYKVLGDHKLVKYLFDEVGPLFKDGGGGYTRVIKLAYPRKGDAAPLAIIELTRKPGEEVSAAPKKSRSQAAPKVAAPEVPAAPVEAKVETPAVEPEPAVEDSEKAEDSEKEDNEKKEEKE